MDSETTPAWKRARLAIHCLSTLARHEIAIPARVPTGEDLKSLAAKRGHVPPPTLPDPPPQRQVAPAFVAGEQVAGLDPAVPVAVRVPVEDCLVWRDQRRHRSAGWRAREARKLRGETRAQRLSPLRSAILRK
jgi:hypothetical protein